jgi:PII-like signaling protein
MKLYREHPKATTEEGQKVIDLILANEDIDDLRIALFLDTDPKLAHEVEFRDPPVLMFYDNEADYYDRSVTLAAYEKVREHAIPGTKLYYFFAGAIETKRFKYLPPETILSIIIDAIDFPDEAEEFFQKHSDLIEIGRMVTGR